MAAEQAEFALRRERLLLRSCITQLAAAPPSGFDASWLASAESAKDVDLGNFAAALVGNTLAVSTTTPDAVESRTSALAAALAWYAKVSGSDSHRLLLIDAQQAGVTARQVANFAVPAVVISANEGAMSLAVAQPAEHLTPVEPHASHLAFTDMFHRAGADVVIEHGVVAAEVAGLEVARVVDEDGRAKVRIGVGMHDRETFRMLHGDEATLEQLHGVVATVAAHRQPGAASHPLNLLAPERALRHRAIKTPQTLGLASLHSVEPPVPRTNLKDSVPCCATGRANDGDDVVVVFVAGVDLDAVPFAADARTRLSPRAKLMIVSDARNIVPTQRRLATLLHAPAEFVSA
ncbi:MAG: hypothetical protein ACKODN_08875 [Actinomycetota bacterium]